ncbi:MAG: hypothetical protein KDM91_13065 [Verrucomicrobiae bacterium]|nr:hypothetical protein [Verrucomicrobiae bacterium]MCP5540476.1 hypothetical protein [Akkermansiaceae bacterium]
MRIESVSIVTEEEGGRIAAYADFSGYLSNGAATLLEPRQRREGYRIYLEVMERIPKDAVGTAALVPIERRIPIDTAGLAPGVYIVNLNGREEHLEIDGAGLRPASDRGQFL